VVRKPVIARRSLIILTTLVLTGFLGCCGVCLAAVGVLPNAAVEIRNTHVFAICDVSVLRSDNLSQNFPTVTARVERGGTFTVVGGYGPDSAGYLVDYRQCESQIWYQATMSDEIGIGSTSHHDLPTWGEYATKCLGAPCSHCRAREGICEVSCYRGDGAVRECCLAFCAESSARCTESQAAPTYSCDDSPSPWLR